jgi:membrane protease YdiL (CAAX protease family)
MSISPAKTDTHDTAASARLLAGLIVLPLLAVVLQQMFKLDGVFGYSLYKVFLLVPPLIYCRRHGIGVMADVLKPANWRNHLPLALGLGAASGVIFLAAYFLAVDWLVDRSVLVERIGTQFSVTAATVALIAPLTIFFNSLLEEFFYRGFAFGLLVKKHTVLGYCLPAAAFSAQHLIFINQWLSPWLLLLAAVALFVLSCVLQWLYEKADSIVAPWIVHILADVAMMLIAITLLW